MKVLLTGGAGFVARHLAAELQAHRHAVVLTDAVAPCEMIAGAPFEPADLCDQAQVSAVVSRVRPDAVVHLGAISFVPDGAMNPGLLARVNVGGTANVLDAVAAHVPTARVLFVSTAQVLSNPPLSAYAQSKLEAEQKVLAFVHNGHCGVVARPANHTGPGQSPKFVIPSFVRQAQEIKAGRVKCFVTGNLESVRDFTDVRDVVAAYRLILEQGASGATYCIGSSERFRMREVLDLIKRSAEIEAPDEIDPSLYRPTDASRILDTTAIRALGWTPRYSLSQTIRDMLHNMYRSGPPL